ncbi:MAG: hypothetical protein WCF18_23880, partial [Chthoniobacteraceae bacterium]
VVVMGVVRAAQSSWQHVKGELIDGEIPLIIDRTQRRRLEPAAIPSLEPVAVSGEAPGANDCGFRSGGS